MGIKMMGLSRSTDLDFFLCIKEISRKVVGLRQSTDLYLFKEKGRKMMGYS